jgi:hypothetical protein
MKRRQFLKQSAFAAAILPVPLQPLTFNQKKRQAKGATTGTLGQLRALDIQKRTVGGIEVFFTPGYEDRAVRLAEYVSEATAFFAESLRVKVEFHLAVLADTHWSKVRRLPYGDPGLQGPPWVIVVPATTDRGAIAEALGRFLDATTTTIVIDDVTIHELGHVYASDYVYPPRVRDDGPPLRWLDELLATYFATVFIRVKYPERAAVAEKVRDQVLAGPVPRYTSLEDFEDQYFTGLVDGPQAGPNYGWYQMQFAALAVHIQAEHGVAFLEQVKKTLPWSEARPWKTEMVVRRLEQISPGVEAWAESLRAKSRSGR